MNKLSKKEELLKIAQEMHLWRTWTDDDVALVNSISKGCICKLVEPLGRTKSSIYMKRLREKKKREV